MRRLKRKLLFSSERQRKSLEVAVSCLAVILQEKELETKLTEKIFMKAQALSNYKANYHLGLIHLKQQSVL
jgi:hypothetical protein